MRIALKKLTDMGQIGHKEEMYQIDVQRTPADILQRGTHKGHLREILMIVAEYINVMVSSPKREMVSGTTAHVMRIVCHFR